MRQSLLLWLICFSLSITTLTAQSAELEYYFHNSRSSRLMDNHLSYMLQHANNRSIGIEAMTVSDNRLNFDQNSRRSTVQMKYLIQSKLLNHNISTGYEYLYDSSSLQQELSAYQNRTGFLAYRADLHLVPGFELALGGKAFIRKEQDRYAEHRFLNSDGSELNAALNIVSELGDSNLGLNANLDAKKMDWEAFRQGRAGAWYNYDSRRFTTQQIVAWDYREDDLYVLQVDEEKQGVGQYSHNDSQKRNQLSWQGGFHFHNTNLQASLSDHLTFKHVRFENNAVRSNEDLTNQATLNLNYQLTRSLGVSSAVTHHYAFKDFTYLGNTRSTELRSVSSRLAWEYLPLDTLFVSASIDLQRTSYPQDKHRWDNDLLNKQLRLGGSYHYKRRIRFAALTGLSSKEDVYLDGILSSNNKTVKGIYLQPECDILFGDRLVFAQDYFIRADYTDYIYGERAGSLYRQLGYQYSLRFDSYPLIANSNDPVWMLLPYRQIQDKAIMIQASFAYEQNDYADSRHDYYVIGSKNIRKTATLTLKRDISPIYVILEPAYSWGTWTRYSILFGMAWRFNNESMLELSINPVGDSVEDLDWKSSVNLNLRF